MVNLCSILQILMVQAEAEKNSLESASKTKVKIRKKMTREKSPLLSQKVIVDAFKKFHSLNLEIRNKSFFLTRSMNKVTLKMSLKYELLEMTKGYLNPLFEQVHETWLWK